MLLLSDINAAETAYKSRRGSEYGDIKSRIEKAPPKTVSAQFKKYQDALRARDEAEKALKALGWEVSTYSGVRLHIDDWRRIPQLKAHDSETSAAERHFADMRRSYTLKLFANGEEVQALFAVLAEELKAITK